MTTDVLHQVSEPGTTWSRVNIAEAMPGVQTPLSWSFWHSGGETAYRTAYAEMGLIPRSELRIPSSISRRYIAIFFGRGACNLDAFQRAMSALPGSVGRGAEHSFFASNRDRGVEAASSIRRGLVGIWLPFYAAALPRRLGRLRARSHEEWRASIVALEEASLDQARESLLIALARFSREVAGQIAISTIASICHRWLMDLLRKIDRSGWEMELIGGYGTTEEVRLAEELWCVSRRTRDLGSFLDAFGFHSPLEGELSSRSWREDPTPLKAIMAPLSALSPEASPAIAERRMVIRRERIEREILTLAGNGISGWWARSVLTIASHFMPLRVVAKAAFTQTIDVARSAARAAGRELFRRGDIDDPEDVFFLTIEELSNRTSDLRKCIALRREQRERFLRLDLPTTWSGNPEPIHARDATQIVSGGVEISGLGVSAGVCEGIARVMSDPSECTFEAGEILVCQTTDPSWSPYLMLAAAAVIDIGGPLSHGAIVARELGIPCVINTGNGTAVLHTGDRLRVDGLSGTVEVLTS